MPTFKVTLAYDGTDFVGWQRQANGVSVQGLLEVALRELDGHDVDVAGASRTDSGVHALGQVASFDLVRTISPEGLVRALNAKLPPEIRVRDAADAPPGFNARYAARAKTYRYRLWNDEVPSPFERRYAWHLTSALDVAAMRAAAQMFEGCHDFAAFQASGGTIRATERQIASSRIITPVEASGPGPGDLHALITYEITGNGFLRYMVRSIVGTLVEIGRGRWRPEHVRELLTSRERAAVGQTAPAAGLFLVRVHY